IMMFFSVISAALLFFPMGVLMWLHLPRQKQSLLIMTVLSTCILLIQALTFSSPFNVHLYSNLEYSPVLATFTIIIACLNIPPMVLLSYELVQQRTTQNPPELSSRQEASGSSTSFIPRLSLLSQKALMGLLIIFLVTTGGLLTAIFATQISTQKTYGSLSYSDFSHASVIAQTEIVPVYQDSVYTWTEGGLLTTYWDENASSRTLLHLRFNDDYTQLEGQRTLPSLTNETAWFGFLPFAFDGEYYYVPLHFYARNISLNETSVWRINKIPYLGNITEIALGIPQIMFTPLGGTTDVNLVYLFVIDYKIYCVFDTTPNSDNEDNILVTYDQNSQSILDAQAVMGGRYQYDPSSKLFWIFHSLDILGGEYHHYSSGMQPISWSAYGFPFINDTLGIITQTIQIRDSSFHIYEMTPAGQFIIDGNYYIPYNNRSAPLWLNTYWGLLLFHCLPQTDFSTFIPLQATTFACCLFVLIDLIYQTKWRSSGLTLSNVKNTHEISGQ
ncbi:MAG: hypothetical protein ACTSVZ_07055, partial [Promethearchaeota archaeon]